MAVCLLISAHRHANEWDAPWNGLSEVERGDAYHREPPILELALERHLEHVLAVPLASLHSPSFQAQRIPTEWHRDISDLAPAHVVWFLHLMRDLDSADDGQHLPLD
eukprot:CAMPEP_0181232842 /NCGR_PEP_ID=MMETSP1096-20121128/35981_1 /TAXON_ID=156174 ORGANISM="Chrysochromulina ericina, Strain CCMP281" /NCGR_SAMPLE_ID=MMETSP1096 /ASSEMBLY_ACC=CAM_ASM_000453 /LENGTH=106 /DNA_ID=CAMNT_0023327229 /DNA_START=156 /DNA_END=476 /DNA_ORIENTATION=-